MKRLSVVQESIAARSDIQHTTLTEDYITLLYLRLLITSLPKRHDLRTAIQTLYAKCQSDVASLNTLDTNVSTIKHNLFQLQLTEDAHIDATDNNVYHRPHRPFHKQKPSPHPYKQRANAMQHKKKCRNVRCWGCGRNHHLRDCPTTSAEARSRLWEEYRNRSAKNDNNKDSPSPSQQHTNDRPFPHTRRSAPMDRVNNITNNCNIANHPPKEDNQAGSITNRCTNNIRKQHPPFSDNPTCPSCTPKASSVQRR
jgi:hypothetical protein